MPHRQKMKLQSTRRMAVSLCYLEIQTNATATSSSLSKADEWVKPRPPTKQKTTHYLTEETSTFSARDTQMSSAGSLYQ